MQSKDRKYVSLETFNSVCDAFEEYCAMDAKMSKIILTLGGLFSLCAIAKLIIAFL